MSSIAKQGMEQRTVLVDRLELVKILEKNRDAHVNEYSLAVAGFKDVVKNSIEESFRQANEELSKKYDRLISALEQPNFAENLNNESIVDPIYLNLEEPVSYERDYTVAIEMAKWDTREELELTHGQFRCFVLDDWDWKSEFQHIAQMYNQ